MKSDLKINGAESLVRTLVHNKVDVCFSNPGTSEMHFVAALDKVPGIRCVLGLFEGVLTGAADGYYRMTGRPASTLLHLGPGLANALASVHNAKKAHSGMVNIIGQHTLQHLELESPLTSDIEAIAKPVSHWVKTSKKSEDLSKDGAEAIEQAKKAPGQISSLILPADTAWGKGGEIVQTKNLDTKIKVSQETIKNTAEFLSNGKYSTLLLGGGALTEKASLLAGKIASKTGCGIITEAANARLSRGAGRLNMLRIPGAGVVDRALAMLEKAGQLVLVGSKPPVAFFGYPDKPSLLYKEGTPIMSLADVNHDIYSALVDLATELDALNQSPKFLAKPKKLEIPSGNITKEKLALAIGNKLPEDAIVVDESVTTGRDFFPYTAGAPPHDWINNRGGAIGYGMPVSIGAAVACPDRKVILLEGDGSGMYTVQSLWTMARENLDITVLIFANRTYEILKGELINVGVQNPGPRAVDMLTLDRPNIDWINISKGMGVEAVRVSDCSKLLDALKIGIKKNGPFLIEIIF
ncbi:MAG: putative acetolactate synthase large subunit IlvX [Alphaproteobacteria bacterium MarineAlpha9_Bin3]|nr:MAG: putative acetolactate synthase large subunit IlvX [Alphaproteobacteria bacterium MarineAlpha9_Bin3]|tara:strand:- start:1802 stop:3373 length:1572 start_codon:yes stop_codon:yes gene_type:complete